MTNEVMPEPRKTKREELIEGLTLSYTALALYHTNAAIAELLVDRIIALGWQWHPPKLEPEQEIEMMDRIISGLPMRVLKPANPEGPFVYKKQKLDVDPIVEEYMEDRGEEIAKLYDVASLHPQEVVILKPKDLPTFHEAENTWVRLPDFDNYEVNALGTIRNRWTRRELETVTEGNGGKYVEMHDKEGFAHYVSVDNQVKIVFGE